MRIWRARLVVAGADEGAGEPLVAPQADDASCPPAAPSAKAAILAQLQALAATEALRITLHAHGAMRDEAITLDDVLEAIATGHILEDYPDHRRGACCLLGGHTRGGRPLHVVCTSAQPVLVIITVYEPQRPKWLTPTQRRPRP